MLGAVTLSQRYLGTRNAVGDLKFINAIAPQSVGIIVLDTCLLLGRRMITEGILRNTVYGLFNISFSLRNKLCQSNFI
jgi:hypothetical protein